MNELQLILYSKLQNVLASRRGIGGNHFDIQGEQTFPIVWQLRRG